MTPLASSVLDQAGRQLGGFLPRLAGAVALLVVGLFVVWLLTRILTEALRRGGVDGMADRAGINRVLAQAGLGSSLARVVGRALRLALAIVIIFAALSLLGLQFLSDSLNKGIQELPKLLIGAALVLVGVVLAGAVRERAQRLGDQMDLPVPLGRIAQITVLAIFGIVAAAQIAISTLVLLLLVGLLLGGVVATFALAFGLGGREVARSLSAGRYVRHSYREGEVIGFGDVRGTVTAIEPASTLLDVGDGRTVRVPNHLLLESVVTIYPDRDELGQ
ncbi:MAG: mechanosensitive ion channel [Solirubrobacterales bacterium]|nr:mechanosensitive ion channel [Solirubrobacterales bacterium]